jgi:hypothetical protein
MRMVVLLAQVLEGLAILPGFSRAEPMVGG